MISSVITIILSVIWAYIVWIKTEATPQIKTHNSLLGALIIGLTVFLWKFFSILILFSLPAILARLVSRWFKVNTPYHEGYNHSHETMSEGWLFVSFILLLFGVTAGFIVFIGFMIDEILLNSPIINWYLEQPWIY